MEGFTEHYLLDKFSSQRTAVALPSKERLFAVLNRYLLLRKGSNRFISSPQRLTHRQ